jgi:hypothetical protein
VKYASDTNPQNPLEEIPDMNWDKKDVIYVVFSWNGKV